MSCDTVRKTCPVAVGRAGCWPLRRIESKQSHGAGLVSVLQQLRGRAQHSAASAEPLLPAQSAKSAGQLGPRGRRCKRLNHSCVRKACRALHKPTASANALASHPPHRATDAACTSRACDAAVRRAVVRACRCDTQRSDNTENRHAHSAR